MDLSIKIFGIIVLVQLCYAVPPHQISNSRDQQTSYHSSSTHYQTPQQSELSVSILSDQPRLTQFNSPLFQPMSFMTQGVSELIEAAPAIVEVVPKYPVFVPHDVPQAIPPAVLKLVPEYVTVPKGFAQVVPDIIEVFPEYITVSQVFSKSIPSPVSVPLRYQEYGHQHDLLQFPGNFSFGVASGAYNSEGATHQDNKQQNIWDKWIRTNHRAIVDGSNADVSADAYNHVEEDVEILRNLGVQIYSFSFQWSRLIPSGFGELDQLGVQHYQKLIQLLKSSNIEPIVSLYNGDLPQYLQDQGGFLNDQFPEWFREYAKKVFDVFGHQVKYWITLNNPTIICNNGYGDGTLAPGIFDNPGVNDYICGRNVLLAHANAYRLYDECYRPTQQGNISISLSSPWYEPASNCSNDVEAAEIKQQFQLGWWAHPIYVGDWPQAMINRIRERSEYDGFDQSRLPPFSYDELLWIKDTHDFFSITFESSYNVSPNRVEGRLGPSYANDISVNVAPINGDVTFGIQKLLLWIKNNYGNPSVIASTGFPGRDKTLDDTDRIDFIKNVLINIRKAMIECNSRVYGFTYYSYIDGFEWTNGYTLKYGLYDVDFSCPSKSKDSQKICRMVSRCL